MSPVTTPPPIVFLYGIIYYYIKEKREFNKRKKKVKRGENKPLTQQRHPSSCHYRVTPCHPCHRVTCHRPSRLPAKKRSETLAFPHPLCYLCRAKQKQPMKPFSNWPKSDRDSRSSRASRSSRFSRSSRASRFSRPSSFSRASRPSILSNF